VLSAYNCAHMATENQLTLVTKTPDLEALAARLARERTLAVDTESNSLHAYRERLCLVQFSTPKEDAIVDPLAVPDLTPLAGVLGDPKIQKVFHAAEYDLIVLNRDRGYTVVNIFDTMIAARVLGRPKVGLGNLLEEEFAIKLEKSYQRADWGQRPLKQEMLEYARLDTHYLIALRDKLKVQLEEKGRWELAAEDFARLPHVVRAAASEVQAPDLWRIKGARDLTPRQAAILQELSTYREAKAAAADVPLFKVMGDATLTAIAAAEPKTAADLKDIAGMTPGQINRHGKGLLDAVRRGQAGALIRRPKRAPYDEAYVERLDKLRAWRKEAAKELEVESDVVLPRDIMEAAAKTNPSSLNALEPLMATAPYRFRSYGEHIVEALKAEKKKETNTEKPTAN
jgi:ribonuclease D